MPICNSPPTDTGEERNFEADDARLNTDLDDFERTRPRLEPLQEGHDGNLRPGGPPDGSRFGFFGGGEREPDSASPGENSDGETG